jgi:hypothetical protein
MEAEDVYQSFDFDEATQQYIAHLRKRSAEWKQRALELEYEFHFLIFANQVVPSTQLSLLVIQSQS